MAISHYCEIHDTPFFKKGKMPGYAHPIGDTGQWCNEDEEETAKPKRGKPEATFETPEKQISIEAQNAYTGVITLLANKIIDLNHPLGKTALNYASNKLMKWSSRGETMPEATVVEKPLVKEAKEMATPDQIKEIMATAKKQGYTTALAVSIMTRLWQKSSSKSLTKREADEFIAVMKQGLYLPDSEVDPKDNPF